MSEDGKKLISELEGPGLQFSSSFSLFVTSQFLFVLIFLGISSNLLFRFSSDFDFFCVTFFNQWLQNDFFFIADLDSYNPVKKRISVVENIR